MVLFDYNLSDYLKYLNTMNMNLKNEKLRNLLNGNGIQNLPAINIITTNPDINRLQSCRDGPIYMGRDGTEFSCRQMCGTNGTTFYVSERDEIFSNGQKLRPGMYCGLVPPNCNLNTTYAVATANSVACRSKFPRMFGGPEGNQIIGCNNSLYSNPGNVLWDYLFNRRLTQFDELFDTDELLPNGEYRFRCKFDDDEFGNRFIPHPIDRLHPQRNYCTQGILRGSRIIQQMPDGTCNCGNYQDTRVRNKLPNDPFSECTSCFTMYHQQDKYAEGGSGCFTNFSSFGSIATQIPCLPSKFRNDGNFCESINVSITEDNTAFPFFPIPLSSNSLSDRKNAIQFKKYRGD